MLALGGVSKKPENILVASDDWGNGDARAIEAGRVGLIELTAAGLDGTGGLTTGLEERISDSEGDGNGEMDSGLFLMAGFASFRCGFFSGVGIDGGF